MTRKKVNWVLDADIRGFFDAIDHAWLLQFVQQRIADRRVLRLIRKWLRAGVSEDGQWSETNVGTPQGAVISPLLANIVLHYVLDLWIVEWRKRHATGDVIVVRCADDFVIGFQHRSEAERCLGELRDRSRQFGLELHPEKTRLIEKVSETGRWLRSVVQGWFNYHAVPGNFPCLDQFQTEVQQLWRRVLRRRSQRGRRWNWRRLKTLFTRWLPKPRILHPYPDLRFAVTHPR